MPANIQKTTLYLAHGRTIYFVSNNQVDWAMISEWTITYDPG
jgi:hypothetical protein